MGRHQYQLETNENKCRKASVGTTHTLCHGHCPINNCCPMTVTSTITDSRSQVEENKHKEGASRTLKEGSKNANFSLLSSKYSHFFFLNSIMTTCTEFRCSLCSESPVFQRTHAAYFSRSPRRVSRGPAACFR